MTTASMIIISFIGLLLRHFNLEKEYPLKTHVVKSISFTLGSGNKRNNTVYMHNFSVSEVI